MRRLLCVLVGMLMACSGGDDSPVEPENRPPTITFAFTKLGVVKNVPVNLSVSVDDLDNDPLTVTWTITRNAPLVSQNPSSSPANTIMRWTVPAAVGIDTVVVSVSDGTATASITEVIKVGSSASGAQAIFTTANSPYIVNLNDTSPVFQVGESFTSEMQAGVELLLEDEGTIIDVTGRLDCQGTDADPVVIRPNLRDLQCGEERGWWEGILVSRSAGAGNAGEIELDHTEIWYAQNAVRLVNDATASLHDCRILCSGDTGVRHEGSGKLELVDCDVTAGRVHGIAIGTNVSTAVPDSVRIERCDITFNEGAGLVVSIDDQDVVASIIVEFNKIERNALRGVTLARASFPAMHFNLFNSNGVSAGISNIYLESGYPNGVTMPTLNATCNYFGANNQAAIDATIRDSLDNPGLVGTRVDTDPWLTQDPTTVPPTCTP